MFKRMISLTLCLLLCVAALAGTESGASADVVGEASGWYDPDAGQEDPSQAPAQQQSGSVPEINLFADIGEEQTGKTAEIYANQTIVADNLVMSLLDMTVWLTGLYTDGNGNNSMMLRFTNDHGTGLEVMTRVAVTVGGEEMVLRNDSAFSSFPAGTSGEDPYIFSNPDLKDLTVRISLIAQEYGREDTRRSLAVVFPIHLLGDYLTDAAKGEIHLPVPDGSGAEFPVYDTAPLMSNEQLTVRVVSVTLGPDEGSIGLSVTTELDKDSLSLFTIDMSVNGKPAENFGWNGFEIPVRMPDGKLPVPVETISFTLGAAGGGIDGLLQSEPFTLVFDGIGVAEKQESAVSEDEGIPEEESFEDIVFAHPVEDDAGIRLPAVKEGTFAIDLDGDSLGLYGEHFEDPYWVYLPMYEVDDDAVVLSIGVTGIEGDIPVMALENLEVNGKPYEGDPSSLVWSEPDIPLYYLAISPEDFGLQNVEEIHTVAVQAISFGSMLRTDPIVLVFGE